MDEKQYSSKSLSDKLHLESFRFIENNKATLELEKLGKQYRKETVK